MCKDHMLKKTFCVLLALFLLAPATAFSEAQESAASPEDEFGPSSGMSALGGENFSMDDIPSEYLEPCSRQGRVEMVQYPFDPENGTQYNIATVYLPQGYDESGEKYNVVYLLHAADGSPRKFLNPNKITALQNLLDHMIADGALQPLIVVAATYYPPAARPRPCSLTNRWK